jgi:phosphoribosylformimino-5-aminoimidazole carboxamide ribonucleotide (ProFAR) isomerase
VRTIIFTDVERDGMQQGLNLLETCALAQSSGLQVIASGGVQASSDVHAARAAGLSGVIVGRALYEGGVQLPALLRELAEGMAPGGRT